MLRYVNVCHLNKVYSFQSPNQHSWVPNAKYLPTMLHLAGSGTHPQYCTWQEAGSWLTDCSCTYPQCCTWQEAVPTHNTALGRKRDPGWQTADELPDCIHVLLTEMLDPISQWLRLNKILEPFFWNLFHAFLFCLKYLYYVIICLQNYYIA